MKIKYLCIVLLSALLCTCSSTQNIWKNDGSYIFYKDSSGIYKCSEPLSVFVDFNNNFHIYEKKNKLHIETKSQTYFIRMLAKLCSENTYDRITVITLCSGYSQDSLISEALNNTALVQEIKYENENDYLYITVKPLESPCPELRFYYSPDFMYCTCKGE